MEESGLNEPDKTKIEGYYEIAQSYIGSNFKENISLQRTPFFPRPYLVPIFMHKKVGITYGKAELAA